ncbi:MAG: sulfatase [Planctomycetaceae bacterium]
MHHRNLSSLCVVLLLTVCSWATAEPLDAADAKRPNFVVIFADDQGYQDLGCFGSPDIETPNIDRMATEGVRLTDFYVSQAVCSASRTALLTGCYNVRLGILGALGPQSRIGIHADELTIAEVLKPRGYATAIFGKWHLGHHQKFLPLQHGFDEYFGLPYSNDMWPYHPNVLHLPMEQRLKRWPHLPLIEGNRTVKVPVTPADQTQLTTWYTEHAVQFIEQHRDEPFFLYVPHSMPHVPLYVSDKFQGKSKRGLYGDVIMEIDWSVGQILEALKKHGLDENTMVIYTSDNGPWLSYGNHGGSALPLREGKGTMWDGGCREPFVARWPGKIPAGSECGQVASTIDILPTLASLAGAELPGHTIDGHNIWPLLCSRQTQDSPHDKEGYLMYYGRELQAVRSGRWKLHFPHGYRTLQGAPGQDGLPGPYARKRTGLELYDLDADISETQNLVGQYPEVVERLKQLADAARKELGDSRLKMTGQGVRPPGSL